MRTTNTREGGDGICLAAWWAVLFASVALAIFVRIRLLDIPLERDEGEYAYAGQLILQRIPPYQLAYNLKFPGTYGAYALLMSIFGQSIRGIHLGLLLTNILTIALIFFLGRRLVNSLTGIAAAAAYAVISVSPSVLGTAAHATHFVVLPVIGGALLLLKNQDRQSSTRLFWSGILFGVGLLMKQPAFLFILWAVLYLLVADIRSRPGWDKIFWRQLFFGIGVVVPIGLTCFLLWKEGVFEKFWFWTIAYAREYAGVVSLSQAKQLFVTSFTDVIADSWVLWLIALIGLGIGWLKQATRVAAGFLLTLFVFSIAAASQGFYFRPHYFILVLPAVCLLTGLAASTLSDFMKSRSVALQLAPLLLFAVALLLPFVSERRFFFSLSPMEACREIYSESPFPESIKIANYVRERTSVNDTIAILGSEPEIYFYAFRHSATGYIYTYGLMEPHKYAHQMQLEMIQEIERARPKFLISVVMKDSWLERPSSERLIFDWANDYTTTNYNPVGLVNVISHDHTDYFFGDIPATVPRLGNYILIYERKS